MLNRSSDDLKSIQSSCQSLLSGDPLDALTGCQKVEDEAQKAQARVDGLSLHPIIRAKLRVKVLDEDLRSKCHQSICDNLQVSLLTDESNRKRRGGQEDEGAAAGEQASATVADAAEDGENGSSDFNEISTSDEMESLSSLMFKGDPSSVSRDDRAVDGPSDGRGADGENGSRNSFLETVYSQESQENPQYRRVPPGPDQVPAYDLPWVSSTEQSNPFSDVHVTDNGPISIC